MITSKKILELRDKRGLVLDEAEAVINKAKAEKRDRATADEMREINRCHDEADVLMLQIKEAEVEARKQYADLDAEIEGRRKPIEKRTASASSPLETRSHAELCGRCEIDPNSLGGWESSEQFWSALLHRSSDPRLYDQRAAGMGTNIFADGGAIVPAKVSGRILDLSLEQEVVRKRSTVYPITDGEGRTLRVPLWNTYDRSSGEISGSIKMSIVGEGAEIPTSKAKLEHAAFDLKKGAVLVPVTNEILHDTARFVGDLEAAIAAAIAFGKDDLLLNGVGAAQPIGALQGANKVTVTAESGQSAATVLFENIIAMESRMLPSSLANGSATWVAHPSTYPQLRMLALPIGTGGTAMPLLQGNARQGWTLSGTELVFTEKAQVLGTEGDISLIDFSRYGVAERPGMRIAYSEHHGFSTDETYLRVVVRFDGKSLDPTPTTPLRGSTFSSVVTLATRA